MSAKPVRIAFLDADGNAIETIPLTDRDERNPFSSGALGYMASGKTILRSHTGNDVKFQITCSMVEVNSKSEALAAIAAERRSKKEQLRDQIKLLQEQAKTLA